MTTSHSNDPSRRSSPYSSGGVTEAEIDQSVRSPVLFFLGWGLFWLLFSSIFALVAALKLHWPQFLDGIEYFTYGRVQAIATNAFLYGWACSGVFAVGLWLMVRLSQVRLCLGPLLYVAGVFWNLAVLLGLGGIFLGHMTSLPALEMPAYTAPVLLLAYALIGAWGVFAFHARQYQTTFTSQWYLLAAFFWFPWIYAVAQMMLVWAPVRGTVQSVVNAWYAYNFFALWLVPLALAALYYFLPKILGRPIRYYYLAKIGFWTYALIAPWCGVARLSSGPVPAWVPTAGIVAMTMLLVPVAIISVNFFSSIRGGVAKIKNSTTLTFAMVAMLAFVLVHVVETVTAFRSSQEVLQFTHFGTALGFLGRYAFFSMMVFAALYFLLPRVLGRGWPFPNMIKMHFWCSLAGLLLVVVSMAIAGWVQGTHLLNPEIAFVDTVRPTLPWLVAASFGWIVLLIGHVAFAWNVIVLAACRAPSSEAEAILLSNPPEMKVQTT